MTVTELSSDLLQFYCRYIALPLWEGGSGGVGEEDSWRCVWCFLKSAVRFGEGLFLTSACKQTVAL